MKRKKLIIFAICIILLVGGLICLNRSFEPIHEKSDDGEWKVCYSKSWFNDLWSGYLFYTGNSSGDAGTIEIKIDTGLTDSDNDDDDEWEPEGYYKNANWDELLACGLQRKMTYFFYDLGDRPKNTTITVNWQEENISDKGRINPKHAGGQDQNMPSCYISLLEKDSDGYITSRIVTDNPDNLHI